MRIDNECVRDILFTVEEIATFEASFLSKRCKSYPRLEKYTEDMLLYHIRYLEMKSFIYTPDKKINNAFDLTPEGHDFLNSIRTSRS